MSVYTTLLLSIYIHIYIYIYIIDIITILQVRILRTSAFFDYETWIWSTNGYLESDIQIIYASSLQVRDGKGGTCVGLHGSVLCLSTNVKKTNNLQPNILLIKSVG